MVVEENSLSQVISLLRRALGESRRDNRYIVTVPRRGYRFVAEVVRVAGHASERAPGSLTVEVLSFDNWSASNEDLRLAAGITESTRHSLAGVRGFRLVVHRHHQAGEERPDLVDERIHALRVPGPAHDRRTRGERGVGGGPIPRIDEQRPAEAQELVAHRDPVRDADRAPGPGADLGMWLGAIQGRHSSPAAPGLPEGHQLGVEVLERRVVAKRHQEARPGSRACRRSVPQHEPQVPELALGIREPVAAPLEHDGPRPLDRWPRHPTAPIITHQLHPAFPTP